LFDLIIDELHGLLYLKEPGSAAQLVEKMLSALPDARLLEMGHLRETALVEMPLTDNDLVLVGS